MKYALFAAAWLACGIASAGLTNAYDRHEFSELLSDPIKARANCGFALGGGIVWGPAALGISFFTTGFGASGWTLSCAPTGDQP